ncbi:MAG TPA: hypothetical protein VMB53_15950 [Gaiellaceae bacterium]|nr:hypothetical protein [Gaiellaceae bacterium]
MSTFTPTTLPQIAPADPTKHVNYVAGMVLGVDDFVQDYTYHSSRAARIVRDLVGYGVVSGLRVSVDVGDDGPRVQVAPGECVTPSGKLICVDTAQCAALDAWLVANLAEVEALTGSPPEPIPLFVVACYRECPTDDVPIPGEPCRTDDELKAPSRLKEGFTLELRTTPPAQLEEDAIREFVAWAKRIPLVDAPGAGVDTFLEALRAAVGLEDSPPASPPTSPPTILADLLGSPPPGLEIPSGDAAEYRAALLRFWVEELRPRLRSPLSGAECGCGGGPGPLDPDADCLLLAQVDVPVEFDAISGDYVVADTPAVTTDDAQRPTLLHLRFLQEWLLGGGEALALSGRIAADATVVAGSGGLTAAALGADGILFELGFPAFDPAQEQVVVGQPIAAYTDKNPSTFEVIPSDDADLVAALGSTPTGIVVRVKDPKGNPVPNGFAVRIEQLGGGL